MNKSQIAKCHEMHMMSKKYVLYLRSSTFSTTLPRPLTLFSDISTCRIKSSSCTTASVVVTGVMVHALHILHSLIVIATASRAPGQVGNLLLHIKLFTLQQRVHNLSQSEIPGAKPAQVSTLVLGLGLEPEEIPLRAGRKFQGVDATVRRGLAGWLVGDEASIGGNHHEIQLGLGVGSAPGAPAEVHQFIFGVEVDVSRSGLGLGHVRRLA